jgi:hypothetical protein
MVGCVVVLLIALAISFIFLGIGKTAMIAMFLIALFAALLIAGRRAKARRQASMADGSYGRRFVYVQDDGMARELTATELDYLNTEFHGADGDRPYIKYRYSSLTPDRRLRGFLLRKKLPRQVDVKPASSKG